MSNMKNRNLVRSSAGFTLIELMVVMITQIQLFGTALDSFRLDTGRYPTTSEGLEALIAQASGVDDWNGPYLKKTEVPLDPWNNPYYYESPGKHSDYDLISFGADKTEGGEKENMDIVSWKGLR